ncbi:MAG: hypothetical protein JWM36_2713 [Hyphomicrobiales bacterium]|nr:hypothetical protein [Hyphomicrobiales bacterium]
MAAYEDDFAAASAVVIPGPREGLGRNAVKALGYSPSLCDPAAGSAFGAMEPGGAQRRAPEQRGWQMWGAGKGGQSDMLGAQGRVHGRRRDTCHGR